MRRFVVPPIALLLAASVLAPAAVALDRPFNTSSLIAMRLSPSVLDPGALAGISGGGQFSKEQIQKFTCQSTGDPAAAVDMSCNTTAFAQDFSPDNEIAIAVDPDDPNHLLAGSNDYFYRFNNATGSRQVYVPTGFFTSFDGGATWLDGQIPTRSGSGAGDPSPAFDAKNGVALMAQLENAGGRGGFFVAQGDVSVSRSTDGGVTWAEPVTVMMGTGAGIGPANQAVFWDKEYLTVDNNPDSPFYGRAYVTATRFLNGLFGSYAESPIFLSWSDDGGLTWTAPSEISGSHPSCTFQSTGGGTDCDEDQFSIPAVGPDGTLYVHFANFQNEAAWEDDDMFDSQIMVVRSTDGGATVSAPAQVAQLEDGAADMPFSVIGRQTVWGHQIRWAPWGNIAVDPTDALHVTVVWGDRGTPNAAATAGCIDEAATSDNDYDPCNAGPGSDLDIFRSDSFDGGLNWTGRTLLDDGGGASQWFAWSGYRPDGSFVAAWDEDTAPAPADTFVHVLWDEGTKESLSPAPEQIDISATHWSGQYTTAWPTACGPAGYSDGDIADAEGKDCNVFHGDYTGLAVGSDGSVNVVWTGLNRLVTTPQVDFYTLDLHDGYAQDAMFARR